jgi:hypothetical protein
VASKTRAVPLNERLFILSARIDPAIVNERVIAQLPSTLARYAGKLGEEWLRSIEAFQKLTPRDTFVYVAASFAYASLPIGTAFEVMFPLARPEAMVRSESVIVAVIHEWVPLPIPRIDAGHRSFCLLDFPTGVPSLLSSLPLAENRGPHGDIVLSTEASWRAFVDHQDEHEQ